MGIAADIERAYGVNHNAESPRTQVITEKRGGIGNDIFEIKTAESLVVGEYIWYQGRSVKVVSLDIDPFDKILVGYRPADANPVTVEPFSRGVTLSVFRRPL